jgi:hypothetical protein
LLTVPTESDAFSSHRSAAAMAGDPLNAQDFCGRGGIGREGDVVAFEYP